MKDVFLSMDVEEWYDLEYLKKYELDRSLSSISGVDNFLNLLADNNAQATFFVLDHVARAHPKSIKKISDLGHEVACHGADHRLLNEVPLEEFRDKLRDAKHRLEELVGKSVRGYRAPCFSMGTRQLDVVRELGFDYDSSVIDFSDHPLYGTVDLSDWNKISEWIYEKDGFFEFKIPTTRILGKNLPISGGGYLRLIPFFLFRSLVSRNFVSADSYLLYIHPFELSGIKRELDMTSFSDKFRFQVGRSKVRDRLQSLMTWLTQPDFQFSTFSGFLNERG